MIQLRRIFRILTLSGLPCLLHSLLRLFIVGTLLTIECQAQEHGTFERILAALKAKRVAAGEDPAAIDREYEEYQRAVYNMPLPSHRSRLQPSSIYTSSQNSFSTSSPYSSQVGLMEDTNPRPRYYARHSQIPAGIQAQWREDLGQTSDLEKRRYHRKRRPTRHRNHHHSGKHSQSISYRGHSPKTISVVNLPAVK